VNPDYDNELFSAQHHMFQTALKYHHIRAVFIDGRHTPPGLLDLIDPYDRWQFREPQSLQEDVSTWYHSTDCSHFCDQGHKQLADLLTQHLRNQQLIS
jgi:hypothetical protein